MFRGMATLEIKVGEENLLGPHPECVMVSKHIVCIFSRFLKVNYRHGNRPNIIAILSLKCAHLVPKKLPRNEFLLQLSSTLSAQSILVLL